MKWFEFLLRGKVWITAGFMLFAWYTDILAFQLPFFAYLICPLIFVLLVIFTLLKRLHGKDLLGLGAVLILTSVFSIVLGQAHDQWLMKQVQLWGEGLRREKMVTGAYPESTTRRPHGYGAVFVNKGSPYEPPIIIFNKFDQHRQSYLVTEDKFEEEMEM